ncbi:MAG: hypothetical protein JXA71_14000 [Chitinispirillaceae bacterium]|nr:hypothetical protein [Chitinispirillaceae bacterium]
MDQLLKTTVLAATTAAAFFLPAVADGVSFKTLLLSTHDDRMVQNREMQSDFLAKGAYSGIPFIDDIELRFRNDAFDINMMRYTVRIRPRGIGETSAAKRFYESVAEGSRLKSRVYRNTVLKERYMLVIEFLEQQDAHHLAGELAELYTDKIKVMESKSQTTDFELDELVSAENTYTKIRMQMFETGKLVEVSKQKIRSHIGDSGFSAFDTAMLVNIDSVIALVEKDAWLLDTNNLYLEQYRRMIKTRESRYLLEKAEGRQYVSYFGFAYNNGEMLEEMVRRERDREYNLNNAYSLELGIKIPDLTMARHDILRRKMDYIAEQENYEDLKRQLDEKMNKDREDLRALSEQYRFLTSRESEVDVVSSLKKYLQMSGVDPLLLLAIKESVVKNRIDMSKLKYGIMRNYIQVIDMSGELSREPLRNFLSQNREVMEP